ncbi:MAG: CYTH and CHAD domain-containing protein [Rhodococcus sp. (in: high G+C Gram-positive bacteria)]|uniref:CYTH and CHAD domain-containing protein n=1 Tax=Rhodococcus sp. TaxID=1831 RepID=UPI003BAEFCBC
MNTSAPEPLHKVERKYEAGPDQPMPSLSGLPGVEGEPVPESIQLSALYYDTADLRLLDAGITLRRREGADEAGWHLELPAGTETRTELQLSPDADGAEIPDEFADLLTGVTRGAALDPVALITTDRERYRLMDSSGSSLTDVFSDMVIAAVPDGSPGPDERIWREIEVAQGTGGRELVDAVESRLLGAYITRSAHFSKLSRALGDRLGTSGSQPDAARSKKKPGPRVALVQYIAGQSRELTRADMGVRRDTEESVHDMRVAARRIRSVLQVYGSHLGDDDVVDNLVTELRWLGQSLGTARDTEVQWSRLVDELEDISEMPDHEIVRARIDEYFSGLAATARPAALHALGSERYLTLLSDLEAFVATLDESLPAKRRPPSSADVARALRALSDAVDKRVQHAAEATTRAERDELTHRARKRAKRMRYTIEATRELSPRAADRALATFKGFQDVLGDYQDAVVARQHLLSMVAEEQHSAQANLGLGMLFHRELTTGDHLATRMKPEWKSAKKAARKLRK